MPKILFIGPLTVKFKSTVLVGDALGASIVNVRLDGGLPPFQSLCGTSLKVIQPFSKLTVPPKPTAISSDNI